MEPTDSTRLALYQLLGRVFYATAKADQDINEAEVATLKRVVKEQWLQVEESTDEFDSDAAHQIEIVFDYLLANEADESNALEDLEKFKLAHPSVFTAEISKLIMDTASKIASSFAKRNKSELVFLSKLFLILKED